MAKEEKKGTEDKAKKPDFESIPENGQKMLGKANKCCEGGLPNCSIMMKVTESRLLQTKNNRS